jgi:hypothetical protein
VNVEKFIEANENALMDYWDVYKFDHLCGEYFHYDNVDYFNEEQFLEMVDYIIENNIDIGE